MQAAETRSANALVDMVVEREDRDNEEYPLSLPSSKAHVCGQSLVTVILTVLGWSRA